MLAYSGVAHMGYLLLALVVTARRSTPVLVYLLAYVLMNAGAFTVVALLYARPGEQHLIADLSGWGYRYPLLGACLAVCMLSLGGHAADARLLRQVRGLPERGAGRPRGSPSSASLASLVGVVYYLRVVYVLYMKPEEPAARGPAHRRLGPRRGGARGARHAGARRLAERPPPVAGATSGP